MSSKSAVGKVLGGAAGSPCPARLRPGLQGVERLLTTGRERGGRCRRLLVLRHKDRRLETCVGAACLLPPLPLEKVRWTENVPTGACCQERFMTSSALLPRLAIAASAIAAALVVSPAVSVRT